MDQTTGRGFLIGGGLDEYEDLGEKRRRFSRVGKLRAESEFRRLWAGARVASGKGWDYSCQGKSLISFHNHGACTMYQRLL